MRLASVKHVCFINRDRVRIDIFDRGDAGWLPRPAIERLDEDFALPAIDFSMKVADVYEDVLSQAASRDL
jgi:hypothetical protein